MAKIERNVFKSNINEIEVKRQLVRLGELLAQVLLFFVISNSLIRGLEWIVRSVFPNLYLKTNIYDFQNSPQSLLVSIFIPQLLAYVFAIFCIHKFIFKGALRGHGFNFKKIGFMSWNGWFVGVTMISVVFLILLVFGKVKNFATNWDVMLFFWFLIMFVVQSSSEEVMMRSFLIPAIENKFGIKPAILISSLLFSLFHIWNPHISLIGVFSIYLAGVMFGLFLVKYRSIWQISFLHASWNFMQGTFFDFNVSGLDFWSWLTFDLVGVDWFTGGNFGVEGSILCFTILLVVIYWLAKDLKL